MPDVVVHVVVVVVDALCKKLHLGKKSNQVKHIYEGIYKTAIRKGKIEIVWLSFRLSRWKNIQLEVVFLSRFRLNISTRNVLKEKAYKFNMGVGH